MKKILKDRFDYIIDNCKGKEVLHLGCIGGSVLKNKGLEKIKKNNYWLHKEICNVAKKCEGLDFDKENIPEAERLSDSKIHFGNVMTFDIKKKFDVVVAGEIIEHLNNFKGFFDSIKKHLKKKGILIVTTPNAYNLLNLMKAFFFGRVSGSLKTKYHFGHVVFFDLYTLDQMLKMHNFQIKKVYYNTEIMKGRLGNKIIRVLGKIRPIYNMNLMVVAKEES